MAKISARGATEVARVTVSLTESDGSLGETTLKVVHVLRSDRVVLRNFDGAGYKRCGRIPSSVSDDQLVPFFERYVARYVAARS